MNTERSLIDQCHTHRPGFPAVMVSACAPDAARGRLHFNPPIHASAAHARTPSWNQSHITDQAEGHIE